MYDLQLHQFADTIAPQNAESEKSQRSQLGCELVGRYAEQRRLALLEASEVELHPRMHLVRVRVRVRVRIRVRVRVRVRVGVRVSTSRRVWVRCRALL